MNLIYLIILLVLILIIIYFIYRYYYENIIYIAPECDRECNFCRTSQPGCIECMHECEQRHLRP